MQIDIYKYIYVDIYKYIQATAKIQGSTLIQLDWLEYLLHGLVCFHGCNISGFRLVRIVIYLGLGWFGL